MMSGSVLVVLLVLQQTLAFHPCTTQIKLVPSTIDAGFSRKRTVPSIRMNAAIPMRVTINIGSKILASTFAMRKQFSFLTTAWKAGILVFVALASRFKSKVKRTISTMEGGWKKRGYNGAFWRTVEVWRFAITFLFKYVSYISCYPLFPLFLQPVYLSF